MEFEEHYSEFRKYFIHFIHPIHKLFRKFVNSPFVSSNIFFVSSGKQDKVKFDFLNNTLAL